MADPKAIPELRPQSRIARDQAGVDLDWLAAADRLPALSGMRPLRALHGELPDVRRDGRRERQPARPDLPDARRDRRPACDVGPEVRRHLDLCLDCRACESACPSGVQYGKLIEPFKVAMQKHAPSPSRRSLLQRLILHHLFPYAGRVKLALAPARWLQKLGVAATWPSGSGLTRLLPPTLRRMQAMLPDACEPAQSASRGPAADRSEAGRVALFLGCVADAMYPETNAATARVLQQNGCEVVIPESQVCCGAIHYHSGAEAPALELARRNMKTFDPDAVDAIIVNAAGCGAMLKDYCPPLPAAPSTTRPRGSSPRSRTSPSSSSRSGRSRRATPSRCKSPTTTPATSATRQQIRIQPRQLLGDDPRPGTGAAGGERRSAAARPAPTT